MAPAREDNSNSYGGLGAGGKFRRHTSRRAGNSKPYDRPRTALRVPNNGVSGGNGWLARLVDPAQRLISYSAHRLFASVFRKRLTSTPHSSPQDASTQPPESGKGERDEHDEEVSLPKRAQVMMNGGDSGAGDSVRSIELEQTLEKMTFTKSETDRLTALLLSKHFDMPSGQEEEKSQMSPSKPVLSCEGNGRLEITPVPVGENGVKSHLALTPAVNQSVHDEDVISPTEIAKSYMGNRISETSRLTDDSNLRGIRHIPQKPPALSIVSRSAGPASASNNGFITPRSRGRSAIYNMARTPYTRVHSRFNLKDAGILVDINARPPSSESLSIWEQTKLSAPREGSLKRKSSVLENDIGSVGPTRRVHQKTNLLPSRSLMQHASVSSVSAARSRIGSDTMRELRSSIEPKHSLSLGNGENHIPATKGAPVQTKSSEMASKILQQLDKLVSSPTKMSPSGLSGKALRSLEKVDSSMFMDNVKNHNKETQSSMFLHAFHDSTQQNLNKIEDNGPKKLLGPPERVTCSASVLDASVSAKETAPSIKCADADATKCDAYNSQQKKRGFQMSVPDDSVDWDDDYHSDGVPSSVPAEDKGKKKEFDLDSKIIVGEAIAIRQPQGDSDIKPPPIACTGIPDDSMAAEENAAFTFSSVLPTAAPVARFSQNHTTLDKAALNADINNATLVTSFGDKAAPFAGPSAASSTPLFSFGDEVSQTKESNVSPIFSFGDKVNHRIEVNAASPIIILDSKNVDKTSDLARSSSSSVPVQSGFETGAFPTSKSESSSGLAATSVGATGTTHLEPEKPDHKSNISKIPEAAFSLPALPSTSAPGNFSYAASSHGSLGTTLSSTISSASPSDYTNQSPSSSSAFTTSVPVSTSSDHVSGITAPSSIRISGSSLSTVVSTFSSAPALKCVSATVPSSMSSTVAVTSGAESDKKFSTNFSNLSSSLLSNTSTVAKTGSSLFGSAPATSSTTNNASQGSPFSSGFAVTTSSPFTAQASFAGSGAVASTQNMPVQFGSSALSPSFDLGVSSGSSASISLFSSSAAATNLFNGGNTCGQNSLASSSEAILGSSGSATTNVSAVAVEPGKSPVFGSTTTNGFAFGASTTAAGASNAAPAVFGSSNSSSSSSSFFSLTSSTSSTSAQSVFGNFSASSQPMFGGTSAASSHPIFGGGSAASASSQSIFGGNSVASSQPIIGSISATSSQPIFGGTSAVSSQPIFDGTSAAASQPIFGGTTAASTKPIFGGTTAASTKPIFGGTTAASTQPIFGGASASCQSAFCGTSASSQPAFVSTLAASQPAFGSTSTASQSAFGNHSFGSPFHSVSPGNNDHMSMEDSMAEDTVQASIPAPATSLFGQPPISPQQSGFSFGSTAPSGPSPFQFGSQQNLSTSQNQTPFQASGSLDFHAGGSFSLGSGGGDKSKRKIIKVKHRGRK